MMIRSFESSAALGAQSSFEPAISTCLASVFAMLTLRYTSPLVQSMQYGPDDGGDCQQRDDAACPNADEPEKLANAVRYQ